MLVLSRKPGEELFIGDKIKVTVIRVQGNRVRIGIEAPSEWRVLRGELNEAGAQVDTACASPAAGQRGLRELELV